MDTYDPNYKPKELTNTNEDTLKLVISKALERDVKQRYQNPEEFISGLDHIQNQNEETIMNIQQGSVGWNWECDGDQKETHTFNLSFQPAFKSKPTLQISIEKLDEWLSMSADDRSFKIDTSCHDIKNDKAKVTISTWNGNLIASCRLKWLALGEY